MDVKVVFHIDENEKKRLALTLGNIKNLLKEIESKSSFISLVANASGVNLFLRKNSQEFASEIKELSDLGVKFFVCSNSINKFEIDKNDLYPQTEIVKAGVLKLIQLQSDEGCSYIKP
jgi:intracellular sulfur oxidation DsrE/DsrF family protein